MKVQSLYGIELYGDEFYSLKYGIYVAPPEIWVPIASECCNFESCDSNPVVAKSAVKPFTPPKYMQGRQ